MWRSCIDRECLARAQCLFTISFPRLLYFYFLASSSGSGNIPSTSRRLLASSSAHVCILLQRTSADCDLRGIDGSQSPMFSVPTLGYDLDIDGSNSKGFRSSSARLNKRTDSRSIRLVGISHDAKEQTPPEPIHPRILPPFLHIFLPGRNTK